VSAAGETIHASALAVAGKGIVIRGVSGSGKSSLLLALLTAVPSAMLVADDRVILSASGSGVEAAVPDVIAGQMEVRGLGVVRRPFVSPVPVALVADLLPLEQCPRMPGPDRRAVLLAGVAVPRICIAIGSIHAPARVLAALAAFTDNTLI